MDGPRDPSFWLYGEENPDNNPDTRRHWFRCRKCGHSMFSASSAPKNCPKCGSPMTQAF